MVWTAPMTAVDGNIFTAAQFNLYVRDNLNYLKTEMDGNPRALASAAGQYPVASGANTIVMRGPVQNVLTTNAGTTTSTSYTATLSGTPGTNPSITVTTGTRCKVWYGARSSNATNGAPSLMSVAVSGATTVAASDDYAHMTESDTSSLDEFQFTQMHLFTGLTPGSNTFTLQYKVGSGTGSWSRRELIVEPC